MSIRHTLSSSRLVLPAPQKPLPRVEAPAHQAPFNYLAPTPAVQAVSRAIVVAGPADKPQAPRNARDLAQALTSKVKNCHLVINDHGLPDGDQPVWTALKTAMATSSDQTTLVVLQARTKLHNDGLFIQLDHGVWKTGERVFSAIGAARTAPVELIVTSPHQEEIRALAQHLPKGSVIVFWPATDIAGPRFHDGMQCIGGLSASGFLLACCATANDSGIEPSMLLADGSLLSLSQTLNELMGTGLSCEGLQLVHQQLDSFVDRTLLDQIAEKMARLPNSQCFTPCERGVAWAIAAVLNGVSAIDKHSGADTPQGTGPQAVQDALAVGGASLRSLPPELQRFVYAQEMDETYARALSELKAGKKKTHWIWFVLPQLWRAEGSDRAQYYGLRGAAEALAYLAHPVLGPRLVECVTALLSHCHRSAQYILGDTDVWKLRCCLTLFATVAPHVPCFEDALKVFYGGVGDSETLRTLAPEPRIAANN